MEDKEKKVIKVGLKTTVLYFIILLLLITLVVMWVYYNKIKPENDSIKIAEEENEVSKKETQEIRDFVNNIYFYSMELPEFTDVNKANEDWVWNTVRQYAYKTEDSQYITYNGIMNVAKEVFGESFSKKFPLQGRYGLTLYNDDYAYDESSAIYTFSYMEWAEDLWPCITVKNIKKNGDKYLVTVVLFDVVDNGAFSEVEDVTMDILNKDNEVVQSYEYKYDSYRGSYVYENKYYTWGELLGIFDFERYVLQNDKEFVKKQLTLERNSETGKVYLKECKDV